MCILTYFARLHRGQEAYSMCTLVCIGIQPTQRKQIMHICISASSLLWTYINCIDVHNLTKSYIPSFTNLGKTQGHLIKKRDQMVKVLILQMQTITIYCSSKNPSKVRACSAIIPKSTECGISNWYGWFCWISMGSHPSHSDDFSEKMGLSVDPKIGIRKLESEPWLWQPMTLAASSHVKFLTQVFFCKGYKSVKQHMWPSLVHLRISLIYIDGISLVAHPSHRWLVR